jgi:hypothetical protein
MTETNEGETTVGGRGDARTLDAAMQNEILRALVDRSGAKSPAARRRALALGHLRLAQSTKRTTGDIA